MQFQRGTSGSSIICTARRKGYSWALPQTYFTVRGKQKSALVYKNYYIFKLLLKCFLRPMKAGGINSLQTISQPGIVLTPEVLSSFHLCAEF